MRAVAGGHVTPTLRGRNRAVMFCQTKPKLPGLSPALSALRRRSGGCLYWLASGLLWRPDLLYLPDKVNTPSASRLRPHPSAQRPNTGYLIVHVPLPVPIPRTSENGELIFPDTS